MDGFSCVGLYSPINNWNIGGIFRASYCYDVKLIVIKGGKNISIKSATDTVGTWRHIPLIRTEDIFSVIPYSCVSVAVEVGGSQILTEYKHPDRAFYIFGPENGSLPSKVLDRCRDVITIPTTTCMNLSATANVVLYDRMLKRNYEVKSCPLMV